jgi:hypothetical protein
MSSTAALINAIVAMLWGVPRFHRGADRPKSASGSDRIAY